jgi:cell division protein FtsW (lipid II flippase)
MNPQRRELTWPGWAIVIAVAVLFFMGLASISASEAARPTPAFTYRQVAFLLVSLGAAWLILRIGFQQIHLRAYIVFALVLLALIPLAVARLLHFEFGGLIPNIRGSYRWIRLGGFQLQPSEFMKVAYILALAWYLRYRDNYRTLRGLVVPFAASLVPLILILLEPDLSTVLLMMPVLFAMLFVAGARVRHLVLIAALGLALAPLLWLKMRPYQRMRITAVVLQSEALRNNVAANPDRYRFLGADADALRREARQWRVSSGMQMVRSKAALGSGGATAPTSSTTSCPTATTTSCLPSSATSGACWAACWC